MSQRARVVVVLGMHRSGTSAVTRGLEALGVALGDDLLPGGSENPAGFFEDRSILDLSDRALAALGLRWDSVRLVDPALWSSRAVEALRAEACERLGERFGSERLWGFKNPRSARLLPFWREVFTRLGVADSYVFATRNPLSVARSLAERDGFPPAKAHLLWLLHATEAVVHTARRPRTCIGFDALLDAPARALARIAEDLALPPATPEALRIYEERFLAPEHRHSRFESSRVALDPAVAALCERAFTVLEDWAAGRLGGRDPRLTREFRRIAEVLGGVRPWLEHLDELDAALRGEREARTRAVAEAETRDGELEASRRELAAQRSRLQVLDARADERAREARESAAGREQALAALADRERALGNEREARRRSDSERDTLAAEGRGLREAGDALQAALAGAERDRDRLLAERDVLAAEREELAAQRDRLGARRDELANERDALASERDAVRAERDLLARRGQALVTERAALRGECDALRTDLERAAARLRGARADREEQGALLRATQEALGRTRVEARDRAALAARLDSESAARWEAVQRAAALGEAQRELASRMESELAADAARLEELCARVAVTRTWRATHRAQGLLDLLKRRPRSDGLASLRAELQALTGLARERPLPHEALRASADRAARHAGTLERSRTLRALRLAFDAANLLRLRSRVPGPAEHLGVALERFGDRLERRLGPIESRVGERSTAPEAPKPVVDVVVPVYAARAQTLRCLESVLASWSRTAYELWVVDDASPDRRLGRALERLARSGAIHLVRNDRNRGFAASANRGLALHPDRDVVLLNSDTEVYGDWLDRLRRAAYGDWRTGTATPFSNNAEICSYPILCSANSLPADADARRLDDLFARANPGRTLTIPTAVGFCMYVRRDCLAETGGFDEERFGRGYGEENDFCLRARERGWHHVLAADTFVYHAGGGSFGAERQAALERGVRTVEELHPGYLNDVRRFIETDPARALRRRVDAARIDGTGRKFLLVSHASEGGTALHVEHLAAELRGEGVRPYVLLPSDDGGFELSVTGGRAPTPNLRFAPGEAGELVEVLERLGIDHVHFHHTLGFAAPAETLFGLPERLGTRYDFTAHDYFTFCPRVHLVDGSGRYCGEPEATLCTSCVQRNGSPVGNAVDVVGWRQAHETLLRGARRVFVPSEDAAARMARHFPKVDFTVRPHRDLSEETRHVAAVQRRDEPLRVGVLGAIGEHKGSDLLWACARDAVQRGLPLEFRVIGYTDRDRELRAAGVGITGRYRESEALAVIAEQRCHLAFLPSVWPETFSYTLTLAFRARLLPVVFDLGAMAERVRARGWGRVLPLGLEPSEINDCLLALPTPPPYPASADAAERALVGRSTLVRYYEGLFA